VVVATTYHRRGRASKAQSSWGVGGAEAASAEPGRAIGVWKGGDASRVNGVHDPQAEISPHDLRMKAAGTPLERRTLTETSEAPATGPGSADVAVT